MVIMIFLMGIYPKLFFSKMDVTVEKFLKDFKGRVEMKADLPQPKLLAEVQDR
jgi:NADH:ubiquinone oxidoreductase subunit 4 (subunit M)